MRRIISLVVVALLMLAMIAVSAVPALADPVNQPFTGRNCHGFIVAHSASQDPEGVGNFIGGQNVREAQEELRTFCGEFQE
jgi:hypothetical protein